MAVFRVEVADDMIDKIHVSVACSIGCWWYVFCRRVSLISCPLGLDVSRRASSNDCSTARALLLCVLCVNAQLEVSFLDAGLASLCRLRLHFVYCLHRL